MLYLGPADEYFLVDTIFSANSNVLKDTISQGVCFLWSTAKGNHLEVDQVDFPMMKNQILFVTEFHKVEIKAISEIRLLRFNRPFYCIRDHDQEVGCKGLLFYNSDQAPNIQLHPMDEEVFDMLWKLLLFEVSLKDSLQYEMLQTLLKRLIILSTRIYKMEHDLSDQGDAFQLYRDFNYLVEMNFRKLHTVADYAALLYKSPKTLSNAFAQYGRRTPLEVIQDRLALEARRRLRYGEDPAKEIAYELGFEDPQSFSRFFKRKTGIPPSAYRKRFREG